MSSQPTHTILNERVKQAFSLTEDDIAANREGHLSATQSEYLTQPERYEGKSGAGCGAFVLILIVGFFLFASIQSDTSTKKILNGLGQTIILMLCSGSGIALLGLSMMGSLKDDIRNKRVVAVEGVIECRSHYQKGEHHYRVSVGRASFAVPKHIYEAFTDGETYRLYYLPLSEVLIAAEHLIAAAPPETVTDSSNPLKPTSAHV